MSDKIKKCSSCGKDYDFEFHGKCPGCGSDKLEGTSSNSPLKSSTNKITLSNKYSSLEVYKNFAYLLMIIVTGSSIYLLYITNDLSNKIGNGTPIFEILILIISYVISIFSLFCLTKIIDFLFDLDKKS